LILTTAQHRTAGKVNHDTFVPFAIANLNARKRTRSARGGCDGPWKHRSAIGPPQPSPDVHLKKKDN
jgi:hypothetical protein